MLENHGLYGFFRRKEVKPGAEEPEGEEKYEVLESPEDMQKTSGEFYFCFLVCRGEAYECCDYCRTWMES